LTEQLSGALDRQKGYTDALTQQNEKLQEIIAELKAASDRETIAKEATEAELRATVQTLKELKQELQKAPEPQPAPSPTSTPKPKGLFNGIFGADGHATGQAEPTPQPEPANPTVSLLVDTLDMHIAALERRETEDSLPSAEDTVDLDALYAPLAKVADAHRKR
jgi:small-conductance mechanosensitive channel